MAFNIWWCLSNRSIFKQERGLAIQNLRILHFKVSDQKLYKIQFINNNRKNNNKNRLINKIEFYSICRNWKNNLVSIRNYKNKHQSNRYWKFL